MEFFMFLNFLFTPQNDFIEVAVMLEFVEENVEYLQCRLFVFVLLVVELVKCGMEFL
jgi:hypothetical protein